MTPEQQKANDDLMALKAMLDTLESMTSDKARGPFLVEWLGSHPGLVKYIRAAFNPANPPQKLVDLVAGLPIQAKEIADQIIKGQLRSLPHSLASKAFSKTDPPLAEIVLTERKEQPAKTPKYRLPAKMLFRYEGRGQGYVWGKLFFDGHVAGQLPQP